MPIGKKIKQLRISRSLTQDIMARIMRIPRTGLAQIENGKQKVYAHQIKYLCLAFMLSADDFITED
jgi:transcriptional regulator with XRE-family HTH domain